MDRGTLRLNAGARAAAVAVALMVPVQLGEAALRAAGLGLFVAGFAFRLAAIRQLGRFYSHKVRRTEGQSSGISNRSGQGASIGQHIPLSAHNSAASRSHAGDASARGVLAAGRVQEGVVKPSQSQGPEDLSARDSNATTL